MLPVTRMLQACPFVSKGWEVCNGNEEGACDTCIAYRWLRSRKSTAAGHGGGEPAYGMAGASAPEGPRETF
jgi:hypothetical protein